MGKVETECYFRFRVRKHPIYTCFFLSADLVEPVRFNRFQTLKTEPNRKFFVIF
jgi:hypothetical protein